MSNPPGDQLNATPKQLRLLMISCAGPGGLGLTGGGMAVCLRLALVPDSYTALGGLIPAILFAYAVQYLFGRARRMNDTEQRVILLTRVRSALTFSIGFAIAGFSLSLSLLFLFGPTEMSLDFQAERILSAVFVTLGLLLVPFVFAARRIPWVESPA